MKMILAIMLVGVLMLLALTVGVWVIAVMWFLIKELTDIEDLRELMDIFTNK
jgi:uncharacterized membrane protein